MRLQNLDPITITLAFSTLITLTLTACSHSGDPSKEDAMAVFKESPKWQSRIKDGSTNLVSFEKTKSQKRNIDGRDIYKLFFNASVEHATPEISEGCSNVDINECNENLTENTELLEGYVLFEKNDIGWEPAGLIIE